MKIYWKYVKNVYNYYIQYIKTKYNRIGGISRNWEIPPIRLYYTWIIYIDSYNEIPHIFIIAIYILNCYN